MNLIIISLLSTTQPSWASEFSFNFSEIPSQVNYPKFLFRYCSNYYSESSDLIEWCDWCQSEERSSSGHVNSSKKAVAGTGKCEYSGDKIKQNGRQEAPEKGKSPSSGPSPRQATRRYKLLKDVMC